mgnify:FL=1
MSARTLSSEAAGVALQSLSVQLSELQSSKGLVYEKRGANVFFLASRSAAVTTVKGYAHRLCGAVGRRCPPQFNLKLDPDGHAAEANIDWSVSDDEAIERAAEAAVRREQERDMAKSPSAPAVRQSPVKAHPPTKFNPWAAKRKKAAVAHQGTVHQPKSGAAPASATTTTNASSIFRDMSADLDDMAAAEGVPNRFRGR